MEDVVFSQIDFGLLMPLLEDDDITDISYSNNGQLWVKNNALWGIIHASCDPKNFSGR